MAAFASPPRVHGKDPEGAAHLRSGQAYSVPQIHGMHEVGGKIPDLVCDLPHRLSFLPEDSVTDDPDGQQFGLVFHI